MTRKTATRVGLMAIIAASLAFLYLQPQSDEKMAAGLVGHWRAVDTSNAALHKHEEGVEKEEIVIQPDGRLYYKVVTKPGPTTQAATSQQTPAGDIWGWKVFKGKLLLRDLGQGSTEEWLPPLKLSVSRNQFSIIRRQFPSKDFVRIID